MRKNINFGSTLLTLLIVFSFSFSPIGIAESSSTQIAIITYDSMGDLIAKTKVYFDDGLIGKTSSQGFLKFQAKPGEHKIKVKKTGYETVTRSVQLESGVFKQIRIELKQEKNQKPVARFSYSPEKVKKGEEVTFNAGESHDPDGKVESYKWDLDGDNKIEKRGKRIKYKFGSRGKCPVKLTVEDNEQLSNSRKLIIEVLKKEERGFEGINFPTFPRGAQDPVIRQLDNGEIWLFAHYAENWQVFYVKSSDGGNTWSEPGQLSPGPYGCYNIDVAQTKSGKIWVVWSGSPTDKGYNLFYRTSDDHGHTWTDTKKIETPEDHDTVPSIVQLSSSKVGIFWEAHYVTTTNGGETWSYVKDTPKLGWNNSTFYRTTKDELFLAKCPFDGAVITKELAYGNNWSEARKVAPLTSKPDRKPPAIRPVAKMTGSSDGRLWLSWYAYEPTSEKSWNTFSEEYTEGATQIWYAVRERGSVSWDVNQVTREPHYHGNYFSNVSIAQLGKYVWVAYSVYTKESNWQIRGKRIGKVD